MDFTTIIANFPSYLELLVQVVGVFAIVATMTPNTSDNAIVDFILRLINFGGANIGSSKNVN